MFDHFPETIFDAPPASEPSARPAGVEVICERCNTSYHIQRIRRDRDNRRLCVKCRSITGHSNGPAPFAPESSEAERIRAQGLINKRIKLGKIERPAGCQHCGKAGKTDGHHPDYSRPDLIVFLCRSCHMKAHRSKAFEAEVAAKKRLGKKDDRNCIPQFIDAVRIIGPRMFLMEQVDGILQGDSLPYFGTVLTDLERLGYAVQYREIDAVSFGVPQFRNRIWTWGIRADLYRDGMRHAWPRPTHCWPPPESCMFGAALLPGITVRQALALDSPYDAFNDKVHSGDEPSRTGNAGLYAPYPAADLVLHHKRGAGMTERAGGRRDHPVDEPSPAITSSFALGGGGGLFLKSHADPPQTIDRPAPALRSGGDGHDGCCIRIIGAGSNPHFKGDVRTERDITDEPCPTIPCSDHFGNVLPKVRYDHGVAELDAPSPTIKAGGNIDAGGKQGGGCPPVIPYRWLDAMFEKHPVFSEAFLRTDPDAMSVVDLFCGGGLGAAGWHGCYWSYELQRAERGIA